MTCRWRSLSSVLRLGGIKSGHTVMWNTEVILPLSPRTEGIRKCNRAWCQYIKHLNNCQRVSSVKTEIWPLNLFVYPTRTAVELKRIVMDHSNVRYGKLKLNYLYNYSPINIVQNTLGKVLSFSRSWHFISTTVYTRLSKNTRPSKPYKQLIWDWLWKTSWLRQRGRELDTAGR